MDFFSYQEEKGTHQLFCEDVAVGKIAEAVGTPLYIYSARTAVEHLRRIREAFAPLDPLVCYSVKANPNLALLKLLIEEGAGCDVVSGGELFRALKAGCEPGRIVYAGVGKTDSEIRYALESGIAMFNVESPAEFSAIDRIAGELGIRARAALRINPDVDPATHRYITTGKRENKFGVDLATAADLIGNRRARNVELVGLHCHIGSQVTSAEPYGRAVTKLLEIIDAVRRLHPAVCLNVGGGFGINYRLDEAPSIARFAAAIVPLLAGRGLRIILEPGRFIVGNAGILVTKVTYVKESGDKRFVICDAGMTDLIRPALYGAYHRVWPVTTRGECDSMAPPLAGLAPGGPTDADRRAVLTDVVGPVCESGDFLALDRKLPAVGRGELLCIFSAGAYGFAMSSNYNSRPRPPEVLVQGGHWRVVRERETYEDLIRSEVI